MKKLVLLAVAAAVLGVGPLASASPLSGAPSLSISVFNVNGGDSFSATPTLIPSPGGAFLASASGATPSFSFDSNFALAGDPVLSGSFTLTNLSSVTQLFSVGATMGGLSPIAAPILISGSFGQMTFTDANGDSAVRVSSPGLPPGSQPFMGMRIDGFQVAILGEFDETASGGPGIFGTHSKETLAPPNPLNLALNSSMGVTFEMVVSPGDSISTPFEFVIVPEPAEVTLFAIGIALFLCAFAQKSASRVN